MRACGDRDACRCVISLCPCVSHVPQGVLIREHLELLKAWGLSTYSSDPESGIISVCVLASKMDCHRMVIAHMISLSLFFFFFLMQVKN